MKTKAISFKKDLGSTLTYLGIFAAGAPLLYLTLGFGLDRILRNPFQGGTYLLSITGFITGITGAYFIYGATRLLFNKGRGLPLSSIPPTKLVTEGVYAVSRHPVYVGACLLFTGIALLTKSFWNLAFSLPLIAAFYFSYARGIEEPVLIDRYGNDYINYRSKTPLIVKLPLLKPITSVFDHLFDILSKLINRPLLYHHDNHLFFWGYGVWPGIGVFVGLALMEYALLDLGFPPSITGLLIMSLTVCCLIGIRFTWLRVTAFREKSNKSDHKQRVGFISWGVIPGVLLIAASVSISSGYSVLIMMDAILVGLLCAHFFGRIGCMFYGCCYGKPCHHPAKGICYEHPILKIIREKKVQRIDVIPVQPLSGLYGAIGVILLLWLWFTYQLPHGLPAALAAVWYGSFRICEEWLREQSVVWKQFIAPAQILAFVLFMSGITTLWLIDSDALSAGIGNYPFYEVAEMMHFSLLAISGTITAILFSYHYRKVGKWR